MWHPPSETTTVSLSEQGDLKVGNDVNLQAQEQKQLEQALKESLKGICHTMPVL